MPAKIAFNTANLVARTAGYRFRLSDWGRHHADTVAKTDEREWAAICREIADAGFTAVEVWVAHVDPSVMTEGRARVFGRIMSDHGLAPIALAGTLSPDTARVCHWLNIPRCAGGLGIAPAAMAQLMQDTGVDFAYENHPEKSVDAILAKVGPAEIGLGVAADTGWLGTQGVNAPAAIRALGSRLRHIHLKDVRRPGFHETCPLGEGCVDIPGVVSALGGIGYQGWCSWEDEPEDRNPFDIAVAMRQYMATLLRSA